MREYGTIRLWIMSNYEAPAQGWAKYEDFYITIFSCAAIYILNYVFNKLTWRFFYAICKEQKDEEIRQAKTLKACNSFYKGVYFIFSTSWGYYLLRDEPYLSPLLLGGGDMSRIIESYPVVPYTQGFRYYYLATMGYHLYQTALHMSHPARNDFVEMFLHHVVTILLYGGSYMCNFTRAGASIMFLHDIADIFSSFVRCYTETNILSLLLVSVAGMTLSWAYTRLFVFPYMIYHSLINYSEDRASAYRGNQFLVALLSVLLVLHYYWFYVLL
jgi:hypothetical protein